MPQITWPIQNAELRLNVVVSPDSSALRALHASGSPMPRPLVAAAVIDTASTVSCVSPGLLLPFGIVAVAKGSTTTASGSAGGDIYPASISIDPSLVPPGQPLLSLDLVVLELSHAIPGVDVLVGMDILTRCKLTLDGPAGTFTLEW